ncbi:MAG: Hsp20/alpha crystallin family protein [Chloroflexi bacterium]|nr:MAG: Hsp20/alpha crystallin family protein [Chloroflexota bacterium]
MSMYIKPYTRYHNHPVYRWNNVETDVHVPLDVIVEDDAYVIEMIVPGLEPDEVEIEIVEKTIIVQGEFKAADEDVTFLRKERPTGKFRRVIRLPKSLDMEKSEASLRKGILSLRVPVAEEALPKTIKIKTK